MTQALQKDVGLVRIAPSMTINAVKKQVKKITDWLPVMHRRLFRQGPSGSPR
jgi:hypothetical protein